MAKKPKVENPEEIPAPRPRAVESPYWMVALVERGSPETKAVFRINGRVPTPHPMVATYQGRTWCYRAKSIDGMFVFISSEVMPLDGELMVVTDG